MTFFEHDLARTLAALDDRRPFSLFLRHAEREPMPEREPYADVSLTAAGERAARTLGRNLAGALRWAAVSPFRRCRQTAQALVGDRVVLVEDTRLGDPGPWMLNPHEGARLFAEFGMKEAVRAQIAGRRWPFVRSLEAGTALLLSSAIDRMANGGSGVCVSHDAVLMPALAFLAGDRWEGRWLALLDGFALQPDARGWRVLWRGAEHWWARD